MTCKLDHSDPDVIPAVLCRACNPPLKPLEDRLAKPAEPVLNVDPELVTRNVRKRRRRLRAEVRELAEDLEKLKLARVGKDMIAKAERKWQLAYQELAAITDKLDDTEEIAA